jgi:immune inhibitor A
MGIGSAPSPELEDFLNEQLTAVRAANDLAVAANVTITPDPRGLGFNDGTIIPPDRFPLGTPEAVIRNAAADRAPLRHAVRVIVVLVDFSDQVMSATAEHFQELFFSSGVLPHGSVKEYYLEVSNGMVDLIGEVVGPFRMPETIAWYANGNYGIGQPTGTQRARDMALHAAQATDPHVDFGPYDNDGNGYVDAFIVVHAGSGGETLPTDPNTMIWSHKAVLPAEYATDSTKIYAYLTIPEDAKVGVCAHELGHLLFGWPDLYDTDKTSSGVGSWCLMGAGEWNGDGDVPAHPSAWCKVNQGWVSVDNVVVQQTVQIDDVKQSYTVLRLWKDGLGGPEYFLVENRQKAGFDAQLPDGGLLVWHVDENQPNNRDENHYKVGLVQADAKRDLEFKRNRGDGGDPYPGTAGNVAFTPASTPSSLSYLGTDTAVSLSGISASGPTMSATVGVSATPVEASARDEFDPTKYEKDIKDRRDTKDRYKDDKEYKDYKDDLDGPKNEKDQKDQKDQVDGLKDRAKDSKDVKDSADTPKSRDKDVKDAWDTPKNRQKDAKDDKDQVDVPIKDRAKDAKDDKDNNPEVPIKPEPDAPGRFGLQDLFAQPSEAALRATIADLSARLSELESHLGAQAAPRPFIGSDLRPDLVGGPVYGDDPATLADRMRSGDRAAKWEFDGVARP